MAEFAGGRLFLLGSSLLAIGAAGFYYLPGMIEPDAGGSRLINSFYVSVALRLSSKSDHFEFHI